MMKTTLFDWQLEQSDLSPHRAFVLEKLCHFADARTFEAYVTIDLLHAHVRGGRRTVQVAMRELEEAGLIANTGRKKRLSSGGLVPIYRIAPDLNLDAVDAPSPAPRGRKWLHGQNKQTEITISKEIRLEEVRNGLPDEINNAFISCFGERAFKSYLKDAKWDAATRTITVRLGGMEKKLNTDCRGFLAHWKIKVVARAIELANA